MADTDALEQNFQRSLRVSDNGFSEKKIEALEERIGHKFSTHERLIRALTHSSATPGDHEISHYERLEFLGDRVLGLCVAQLLFETFPNAREGELSVRLNALVSGDTCAEISDELQLHEFIFAGADRKLLTSKRMKSVRADVVESLIAAIYLDAGLAAANAFITRFWKDRVHQSGAATRDPKTALQEWAHVQNGNTPNYSVVSREGPDHDPVFTVEVTISGIESATGNGRSKRIAEQAAARKILLREGAWIENSNGEIEEAR